MCQASPGTGTKSKDEEREKILCLCIEHPGGGKIDNKQMQGKMSYNRWYEEK